MGEFQEYIEDFTASAEYNKMFYVLHTQDKSLSDWKDTENIKLWDVEKLAILVVNSGLISWLIKKVS